MEYHRLQKTANSSLVLQVQSFHKIMKIIGCKCYEWKKECNLLLKVGMRGKTL